MASSLKFQALIDSFKFENPCPWMECTPNKVTVFRWTFKDITNEDNFLPNHLFERKKGIQNNIVYSESNVCSRCGISFFSSVEIAQNVFGTISPKIRKIWGYTNVAKGDIDSTHGLISDVKKGHQSFFEFEGVELSNNFTIVADLP